MQEDFECTIAQMVYRKNKQLPGEFFQDNTTPKSPDFFVKQLKKNYGKNWTKKSF